MRHRAEPEARASSCQHPGVPGAPHSSGPRARRAAAPGRRRSAGVATVETYAPFAQSSAEVPTPVEPRCVVGYDAGGRARCARTRHPAHHPSDGEIRILPRLGARDGLRRVWRPRRLAQGWRLHALPPHFVLHPSARLLRAAARDGSRRLDALRALSRGTCRHTRGRSLIDGWPGCCYLAALPDRTNSPALADHYMIRRHLGFVFPLVIVFAWGTLGAQGASAARSIRSALATAGTNESVTIAGRATAAAGQMQRNAFEVALQDTSGGIRIFSRVADVS